MVIMVIDDFNITELKIINVILESLCIHSFHSACPGEIVLWPVSRMIHRRVLVLGMEETPLLTDHQLVSWSSPGPDFMWACTGFLRMKCR